MKDWKKLIRKKDKRVDQCIRTLFQEPLQSRCFLLQVGELCSDKNFSNLTQKEVGYLKETIAGIRQRFFTITQGQFDKLLEGIRCSDINTLTSLMAGTQENDFSGAERVFKKILELGNGFHISILNQECPARFSFLNILINTPASSFSWRNLLAFAQDNIFARETLGKVLAVYARVIEDIKFVERIDPEMFRQEGLDIILAPEKYHPLLRGLWRSIRKDINKSLEGLLSFLEWFKTNREVFDLTHAKMWHEIEHEAKSALRTDGLDKIELNFSFWKKPFEYTHLQLFPGEFPECTARFWLKDKQGGHATVDIPLSPRPLSQCVVAEDEEESMQLVDQLQHLVATACFHSIVMCQEFSLFSTTLPETEVIVHAHKSGAKRSIRSGCIIRPRLRKLPQGYKPGKEAIGNFIEAFRGKFVLPPGKTFVKQYSKGVVTPDWSNAEPLFSVADLDLGYASQ